MVSVTLSIPNDVKEKMDHFSEINWSGFIRKAIVEKATEMTWREEMLKRFEVEKPITDFALEIQKKARKGRYKILEKKGII
jgi:hypothetical protein